MHTLKYLIIITILMIISVDKEDNINTTSGK